MFEYVLERLSRKMTSFALLEGYLVIACVLFYRLAAQQANPFLIVHVFSLTFFSRQRYEPIFTQVDRFLD